MKYLMLFMMMLLMISCSYNLEASRAQMEYIKNRDCKTIQTRVTKWDSNDRLYKTVGYDYTTICK